MKKILFFGILFFFCIESVFAQFSGRQSAPGIQRNASGRFEYSVDQKGNRIPDYSYCGYFASEKPIPDAPVKAIVKPIEGDATVNIQKALDFVASLEPDEQGIRGAVLLDPGVYKVSGQLNISTSGIVLRGSGSMENGTLILGTGDDRQTLIRMAGKMQAETGESILISGDVPVGAMAIVVRNHPFKAGDDICIKRPGILDWISEMDMHEFGGESSYIGWKVNKVDVGWERRVTAVNGDSIHIDAPLTCELDERYGGGMVSLYKNTGRIAQCGIENLRLTSTYDQTNAKDENHRWVAINMDQIEDSWVRRVEFRHFAGSAVFITETGRRITAEDCKSLEPISEIGGQRRYSFYTLGAQCLFQRLYAEYGFHDFAVGRLAPGPNAFVDCYAHFSQGFSGTIDSWSTGVLFDAVTIEGNGLFFSNRGQDGLGAGWTTGNSMMWNCSASLLACPKPPTAYNWSYGAWGQRAGNGSWNSAGSFVNPRSLFYAQLEERLGKRNINTEKLMPFDTQSATNPPIDKAQEFVQLARNPALLLNDWIDTLILKYPIRIESDFPKKYDPYTVWNKKEKKSANKKATISGMSLQDGVLIHNNRILIGTKQGVQWWRGDLSKRYLEIAQPHISRFVTGISGIGYTDDLNEMTDNMVKNHVLITDHNYGLWYDRRRDDHERIRRMDGYVWAPFYEMPFARSGEGTAWDGLSKYDLTKWNVWYWNRLRTYADLADQKGLVLYHQHYFQHNILEAGAHWADFPWRSANNINQTGFPEPVPYAGDKRVFMSELFYDVDHTVRRALHRNYIRKCLDNFSDNQSVIHFISEEYTGPLHFTAFWIDVIAEWEAETGKNALVALSTTKDVQDAIMADPVRSKTVDIIDMKYWSPAAGGGFRSLRGGIHLAPRQQSRGGGGSRTEGSGSSSMEERVYETVREFRKEFPDKAFINTGNSQQVWPSFMAGASLCNLPDGLSSGFLQDAAKMSVIDAEDCWLLGNEKYGFIAYPGRTGFVRVDLSNTRASFIAQWIDTKTGQVQSNKFTVKGGSVFKAEGQGVLWMQKK